MKQFIKRFTVFSVCTLILMLVLQVFISVRIKGKNLTGHDNLETTANVNADLIFLGSSRCLVHFDPAFFDTGFNLKSINIGVDGHSEISMASIRLKDYLSRNSAPAWAIFNFDPFVNAGSELNNGNLYHKNVFARYAFFPSKKDLPMLNYFQFSFLEKYIPLYAIFKYRMLMDCLLQANAGNSFVTNGYEVHDESWDTTAHPVTDVMKGSFFIDKEPGAITNALRKLKELCAVNNIKLLCIQTPVYKVLSKDSAFSKTARICNELNIPFVDANKMNISNDIDNFYNSFHLNKKGVIKMNEMLKKESVLNSFLSKKK